MDVNQYISINESQHLSLWTMNSKQSSLPMQWFCGVPQISALGPVLVIIHLNDMPFILQGVTALSAVATTIRCYASNAVSSREKLSRLAHTRQI